jgi:hypothetical protein
LLTLVPPNEEPSKKKYLWLSVDPIKNYMPICMNTKCMSVIWCDENEFWATLYLKMKLTATLI